MSVSNRSSRNKGIKGEIYLVKNTHLQFPNGSRGSVSLPVPVRDNFWGNSFLGGSTPKNGQTSKTTTLEILKINARTIY